MTKFSRKNRKREIPNDVVRYVDHAMSIAKQIDIFLRAKGINQADLAKKLGKKESQISKWMSGTHNFTFKTISKIESVLDEQLIFCPREIKKPEVYKIVAFSEYSQILVKDKGQEDEVNVSLSRKFFVNAGEGVLSDECICSQQ
jgi:transcriptional regulator with XRE-family HTH domain